MSGIEAEAHKQMDYYNFLQSWEQGNNGSIKGADSAFMKYHPDEQYIAESISKSLPKNANVPPEAIRHLIENPKLKTAFDKHYGPLSQYVLAQ